MYDFNHPLLTAEEELALLRTYKQGREAAQRIEEGESSVALRRQVRLGDQARDELLAGNMRLIRQLAQKFAATAELEDLVQEGILGFLRGLEGFDLDRGLRLSTYAVRWTFAAVQRAAFNTSRDVRVPIHQWERRRKVITTTAHLEGELGREPTADELAEATGFSLEALEELEMDFAGIASLNALVATEEGGALEAGGVIADPQDVEDDALAALVAAENHHLLEVLLPPLERQALMLRFARPGKQAIYREIGSQLNNVSGERVRQLIIRGLQRLQHPAVAGRLL